MNTRYLITSALPYINGVKHLGNLVGSMLPADVYARYLRLTGRDVLFICATDEHGTPAELAALEAGLDVADYCRRQHATQADLCRRFDLSFDHFGRSSSAQNHALTRHFARRLEENGLIEERLTRQVYSVADHRFLPDRYVIGTCPHCGYVAARGDQCENCTRLLDPTDLVSPRSAISGGTELEVRDTRHLFLLLSKLGDRLRQWITGREGWPLVTTSIALKWLDEGLQDRCITRDLRWGVPVDRPGFEGKVFYVWFDAPIEYIAAAEEWAERDSGQDWERWWLDTTGVRYTQFMAKDNVPFHTIVFPATLIGSGEPWKLPDFIKAFNWLTYYGGKFSTSQHLGVFMSDAIELLPSDCWRYYLMANAPESDDADFSWDSLAGTVNKDLVGVFGNLVNRLVRFAGSRFGHVVPEGGLSTELERRLEAELGRRIRTLADHFESLSFRKALQELRAIWVTGNTYVADSEPWKRLERDPESAALAVRVGLNLVRLVAVLSQPLIPSTATRILDALGADEAGRRWPDGVIDAELRALAPGHPIQPLDLLFRRISDEEVSAWTARFGGGAESESQTWASS
jgi:methionyl-tRNA synthetase